jgi:hypothetical protein
VSVCVTEGRDRTSIITVMNSHRAKLAAVASHRRRTAAAAAEPERLHVLPLQQAVTELMVSHRARLAANKRRLAAAAAELERLRVLPLQQAVTEGNWQQQHQIEHMEQRKHCVEALTRTIN